MTEKTLTLEPGDSVKITLPHGIGFVEIRTSGTSGTNGPTGYPTKAADVPRETSEGTCTEGARRPQCYPFHTDDCPYV